MSGYCALRRRYCCIMGVVPGRSGEGVGLPVSMLGAAEFRRCILIVSPCGTHMLQEGRRPCKPTRANSGHGKGIQGETRGGNTTTRRPRFPDLPGAGEDLPGCAERKLMDQQFTTRLVPIRPLRGAKEKAS